MVILFPSSYDNTGVVDEMYETELEVAKEAGHEVRLFNFDEFIYMQKPVKLNKVVEVKTPAIYRGFMMLPKQYEKFYLAMHQQNLELINTKFEYLNTHEFVNAYDRLKNYTPEIRKFKLDEKVDWVPIRKDFGRFLIKDYVKSIKGMNFPRFFDSEYSKVDLDAYLHRFKELRGDALEGGIIIKKYVSLKQDTQGNTNEYRLWFYKGRLIQTYRTTGRDRDYFTKLSENWARKLPKLGSNFYTIDVAELKNGGWIVIETGDGQVSGYNGSELAENRSELLDFYKKLN